MSKIIIITGPTASKKSDFGIRFCEKYPNSVIVNSDSMQVYKELPIITAQPNQNDRQKCEHRLYGAISANQDFNANIWLQMVKSEIEILEKKYDFILIIGGSVMYIDLLINGISNIPDITSETQDKLKQLVKQNGISGIYQDLVKIDNRFNKINQSDSQRIHRAMEVYLQTGKCLYDFEKNPSIIQNQDITKIALMPNREENYINSNNRFDDMIRDGAIEEVESYINLDYYYKKLNASYATGVPEITSFLQGKISKKDAIDLAKQHTRNYIKRQSTWIRNRFKDFIILDRCDIKELNIF